MADLNGIVIPVDTKQVIDAINKTKSLEGSIVKLFNSYTQGNITQKQFSEGLRSLNKDYVALGASVQKSTAVIRGYAKELQLTQTAQDNLTAAKKRAETAFALGIQRAEEEQKAIAQSRKETEAWFAQQRRRLAMMEESERMMQRTTGVFGRFGFAAQQVGYQVGDFFVQVQSGTNVLVAFGQQFTQLAGLLTLSANPAIMAWGVALSVVVPLVTALGATWMRTKQKAEDYKDPLKEALDITKKLREETDKIRFPDQTTKAVDDLKEKVKAAQKEVDVLKEKMSGAALFGMGAGGGIDLSSLFGEDPEKTLEVAQQNLAALQEELHWHDLIIQKENAKRVAAQEYLSQFKTAKEEQEKLLRYHAQQLDYMGKTKQESDNFKNALIAAYGVLAQSKTAAAILADQMGRAADNAYRMSTVGLGAYTLKEGYGPMMMGRGQPATGAPTTSLTTQQLADAYGLYGYTRSLNMQPSKTSKGGGGGGGSKPLTFDKYIKDLETEFATKQKLIGLYGVSAEIEKARADAAEALNKTVDKLTPKEIERIDALTKQTYALEQQQQLMETVQNNMSDAFMSMVDGSKSVHKAFKDMMFNILKSIYEQRVLTPMTNALTSMLFSANGNVFNNGSVQAFASGGVVGSPTLFPMAGGKTGLMGEAGPEAIVPLKRGPDGKLGVASSGGGNITVVQNINVTGTGDAAYVRSEVAKMMPQITGATKAAVIDARKRGGQMAAAFR